VVSLENNIPAPPSVAAIRSTTRYKFFPAETAAAIAAVAGFRMDADLINKLHNRPKWRGTVRESTPFPFRLIREQVGQARIRPAGGPVSAEDFALNVRREPAAFAGAGDHFVGDLLGRSGDEVMALEVAIRKKTGQRLFTKIAIRTVHL
jgi:hypothetical protein